MTTLQEALPCPFCGKQHTLQVISGQELMDENQEFWQHSESFGVVCDASTPDGKGGCGAMGGFKPTEDEAIEAWNTRTALAQQREQPVAYITDTEQGPMVWTPEMYDEACTYCDDDEFPVPLYTAAPAPQPAQELTGCACRWDADDNRVATCVRHQGWLDVVGEWAERAKAADAALQSAQPVAQPLSDSEIEKLREKTFSTYNPYCPVDSKSMRKAVRAAEAAHGIGEVK